MSTLSADPETAATLAAIDRFNEAFNRHDVDGVMAATTGDFVLLANEVNPVVKALTENGIIVTALHNHMLYDNPRLFMMHFWAVGDPAKLAVGLKAALDKTNSKM